MMTISDKAPEKEEVPAWVNEIFAHCRKTYLGNDGVFVTALLADGSIMKHKPMLADFGDLLPFAWHFGARDLIDDQLGGADKYLENGLFKNENKVELFFNHDWLLGLLDIYRQTNQYSILELAEKGAEEIGNNYFCRSFLADQKPQLKNLYGLFVEASPFNGGYMELWVELYTYTHKQKYLSYAEKLAKRWSTHSEFKQFGVFSRRRSALSGVVDRVSPFFSKLKSRLFKDNTNMIWGYLELYKKTGSEEWKLTIEQWVLGFSKSFFNNGQVALMLGHDLKPFNISLKAAFSSLDLLCDLAHENICKPECLAMGKKIARYWLSLQWENGLFPEVPGGNKDHLDANVDMVVALNKLCALTDDKLYQTSGEKCSKSILQYHWTSLGYCISVDKYGNKVDGEIRIKYQGLLTKLALLPEEPELIYTDQDIFDLLRDR